MASVKFYLDVYQLMRLCAAISLGGDRLLVTHRNGITTIVVASKTVVETVMLGPHPTQVVAVNPLHNTVYVGLPAKQGCG
jgi:DNA-binding beta-propeller fold protein YncE